MGKKLYISISEADGEILADNAGFKYEEGCGTELVTVSCLPELNIAEKLEAVRLARAASDALYTWLDKNRGGGDVEIPRY